MQIIQVERIKQMEKETCRIFLGTYLEDKSSFENYQSFKMLIEDQCNIKIRWVALENLHFTWKFLGDITQKRIERILNELNNVKTSFNPMEVQFDTIEIWPKKISPRQLIWLGRDSKNNITENFKLMDKSLKNAGFEQEKRSFKPHITLGRFKLKHKLSMPIELAETATLKPVIIEVKKISLIKSDLLPAGPKYTIIEEVNI